MELEITSATRALAVVIVFGSAALAQGTLADYERGQGLQAKARGLVVSQPGVPNWIGEPDRFWYAKTVKGGSEFVLVDAATATKNPPFDHDKLATAIRRSMRLQAGTTPASHCRSFPQPEDVAAGAAALVRPRRVRLRLSPLTFKNNDQTIEFGTGGSLYTCQLAGYICSKGGAIPQPVAVAGRGGSVAPEADGEEDQPMPLEVGGYPLDGLEWQPFPQEGGGGGRNGRGD